jgi:hypothetical protein
MSQPFEIISCAANVYTAFEGEPFPAVNAAPGGNWVLLGAAGTRNQKVGGVKITMSQEVKKHTTVGSLGPVKGFRTGAGESVEVTMEDFNLEVLSKKFNLAGVREVAAASGVAGYKSMGTWQGFEMQTFALLLDVPASPSGDGLNLRRQYAKVIETGNAEFVFDNEGVPVGIKFVFDALEDPNASADGERFGTWVAQTAAPLP